MLLARGLLRLLTMACGIYERLLDDDALLDFAGMLDRAVALLARQEEFARSRLKLQARYHHLLVDEFQDTSRLQWRLVDLLIAAWGEGEGVADAPTSVFIVGDRKQSIYRFRHAEVTLLEEAGRRIAALRPGRPVRQSIQHSFRAVPELLAFVNALADGMQSGSALPDCFRYDDADRFPVPPIAAGARRDGEPVLGVIAEPSMAACADAVSAEIARLLAGSVVRDRSGPSRPVRPDDIAVLFRSRTGHQYFDQALDARGVRTYVYKGLGFFDAPEVQDLQALIRYLARPESDLRAAELLRSRFVRLSDVALARLAPGFAAVLRSPAVDVSALDLPDLDRRLLDQARRSAAGWLTRADRVPASDLIDRVLAESAYVFELRGRRLGQARENVKKVRALIRRVENRGYATLARLADHFETLKAGEESNAVIEASGCVSLMTIHAAKGLEFPVVFLVNAHLPSRGRPAGFSVIEHGPGDEPHVAFGSNAATRLEDEREQEELRRLLYVAVTRARDRLYVAAEIDARGRIKRGAHSLAAVMPPGLVNALSPASGDAADAEWITPRGSFTFRRCLAGEAPAPDRPIAEATDAGMADAGLSPLTSPVPVVRPAAADSMSAFASPAFGPEPGVGSDRGFTAASRAIGTLAHRLTPHAAEPIDREALARLAWNLAQPSELAEAADPALLVERAVTIALAVRHRDDVAALLTSGTCHYEVPFSFQPDDRPGELVRGRIDCVVVAADGGLTVLEFKTGAPRAGHREQLAVYERALRAALPGTPVRSQIVYL